MGENVTMSKDVLYGSIIVVMSVLLIGSVFTQGFGIIKTEVPQVSIPNQPTQQNQTTNQTQPLKPTETTIPTGTVGVGAYPGLGSDDAKVRFVEFSDFECPFCGRHVMQTIPSVKSNYVQTGKVKYYYRDFPLSFHPYALPSAHAARCANEQGKFWEMHDILFEKQESLSGGLAKFQEFAVSFGLDNATFTECFENEEYASGIAKDFQDGQNVGVRGTPSNFVIIPKNIVNEAELLSAVSSLNSQYGDGIILFQDSADYTVMIPGAYPYSAFETVLKIVKY